jgi:hypothetical protein
MKKIIKLTEQDLTKLVKRIMSESKKYGTENVNEYFFEKKGKEDKPDYLYQTSKTGKKWTNIDPSGDSTWDVDYDVEDWEEFEDEVLSKKLPKHKFRRGFRK